MGGIIVLARGKTRLFICIAPQFERKGEARELFLAAIINVLFSSDTDRCDRLDDISNEPRLTYFSEYFLYYVCL